MRAAFKEIYPAQNFLIKGKPEEMQSSGGSQKAQDAPCVNEKQNKWKAGEEFNNEKDNKQITNSANLWRLCLLAHCGEHEIVWEGEEEGEDNAGEGERQGGSQKPRQKKYCVQILNLKKNLFLS